MWDKKVKKWMMVVLGTALFSLAGCSKTEAVDETSMVSSHESEEPSKVEASESADASADELLASMDRSETVSSTSEEESSESMDTSDVEPSDSAESSDETEAFEETLSGQEKAAKEAYEYWDATCNINAIDLTPMEGEYFTQDPEPEDAFAYLVSPDGDVYGFYDDLTDGCSVWCSIDYDTYVNEITASSTLDPQGGNTYDAANLGNRWRGNAWVEGVDGNGIGESVTIVRKYNHGGDAQGFQDYGYDSFFFTELCIVNGMAKDEKAWMNNGRVKSLKLYFNEEYVATLELEDSMRPQFISLSGLHLSARDGEESSFRFEIADVYPGSKYEDTALTGIEIAVFTQNH